MKCNSPKSVDPSRLRSYRSTTASCSAIAVLSVLVPCAGLAQTQVRHGAPESGRDQRREQARLTRRSQSRRRWWNDKNVIVKGQRIWANCTSSKGRWADFTGNKTAEPGQRLRREL